MKITTVDGIEFVSSWVNLGQKDNVKTYVLRFTSNQGFHHDYGMVTGDKNYGRKGFTYYAGCNDRSFYSLKDAKSFEFRHGITRLKDDYDILDEDLVIPVTDYENSCFMVTCGHYVCDVSGKEWSITSNECGYNRNGFIGGLPRVLQCLKDFGCNSDEIVITRLGNQFLG